MLHVHTTDAAQKITIPYFLRMKDRKIFFYFYNSMCRTLTPLPPPTSLRWQKKRVKIENWSNCSEEEGLCFLSFWLFFIGILQGKRPAQGDQVRAGACYCGNGTTAQVTELKKNSRNSKHGHGEKVQKYCKSL